MFWSYSKDHVELLEENGGGRGSMGYVVGIWMRYRNGREGAMCIMRMEGAMRIA